MRNPNFVKFKNLSTRWILNEGITPFLYSYIDDVVIASDDLAIHGEHLRLVFERLDKFGLTINLTKRSFGQSKVVFSGFEVSSTGIRQVKEKKLGDLCFFEARNSRAASAIFGHDQFYRLNLPNAVEYQTELNQYLLV